MISEAEILSSDLNAFSVSFSRKVRLIPGHFTHMVHDCECSIVWPFIQQTLIQGAPATCLTWQRTGERALPGGPASRAGGREVQTINNGTLSGGQWLGQRKEGRQAVRPSCGVTGGGGAGTRAAGARKVRETFERRPVLPGAPWRSGVRVPGRQRTSAEALGGDRLCAPEGEKGQCSRGGQHGPSVRRLLRARWVPRGLWAGVRRNLCLFPNDPVAATWGSRSCAVPPESTAVEAGRGVRTVSAGGDRCRLLRCRQRSWAMG